MKLFSWNVNGLRAIASKNFYEWIEEIQPDIFCLQETKLQEHQLTDALRNIDDYQAHFSFAQKKGYSGTATFTRVKPLKVVHGMGIETFDSEGRIVTTHFEDFTLLNVYFPNGTSGNVRLQYKLEFYDAFLGHCEQLRNKGSRLVICGDYNTAHFAMDLARPKENETTSGFLPKERAWMDKLVARGYVDTFRYLHPHCEKYSYWDYRTRARRRNIGWRIDYFFITKELLPHLKAADIFTDVMGSDHCPVGIELDFSTTYN